MTKKFKQMVVTLLAVMMFFTSVPSTVRATATAVEASAVTASDDVTIDSYKMTINGIERELNFHSSGKTKGKTTLTVAGKEFVLTNPLVAAEARFSEDGTVWIRYKNGSTYWWNYDLQKEEEKVNLHKYVAGILSFKMEGYYVTGLNTSSGEKGLLSVDEQKKVLGITSDPSNPDNPSDPSNPSKPSNPDNPSEPSNPSNPSNPDNQSNSSNSVNAKIGKVIHKGRTYYVYSTKGKLMTKFSLTKKGGKFKWRSYSMKGVLYVGIIRKSKNVVVLTKKAGYKFNYVTMKRSRLYDIKKYGKPLKFEYDKDGCTVRLVTKKPYRFSIKNK